MGIPSQSTDDMLSRIEASMADKIESMVEGPYFYTWGSVNEIDPAKQVWPSAEIRLVDELNVDDDGGAWVGVYLNEATFEIRVRARLDYEVESPYYAINERLNRCLSDLKKCFGTNYSLTPCGLIMYRGMTREVEETGDVLMPKRMITTWMVRYTQERTNPLEVGD